MPCGGWAFASPRLGGDDIDTLRHVRLSAGLLPLAGKLDVGFMGAGDACEPLGNGGAGSGQHGKAGREGRGDGQEVKIEMNMEMDMEKDQKKDEDDKGNKQQHHKQEQERKEEGQEGVGAHSVAGCDRLQLERHSDQPAAQEEIRIRIRIRAKVH